MAKKRKTIADYEREAAAEDKKRASQFVVPRPAPRADVKLPKPQQQIADAARRSPTGQVATASRGPDTAAGVVYDKFGRGMGGLRRLVGGDERASTAARFDAEEKLRGIGEFLLGPEEIQRSARGVSLGEGTGGDYATLGLAAVPFVPKPLKSAARLAVSKAGSTLAKAAPGKFRAFMRDTRPIVDELAARPEYTRQAEGPFTTVARRGVERDIRLASEAEQARSMTALRRIAQDPERSSAVPLASEASMRARGVPYDVGAEAPVSSLARQGAIGRAYEEAVAGSPAYKQAAFERWGEMYPEIVEKAKAQNLDQLTEASYNALSQDVARQFDTLPLRLRYHEGAGEYGSPNEMVRDVLARGNLNVFSGGEPHEFLSKIDPATGLSQNEMFRAVHDYYGHVTPGSMFGAPGEEIAYAAHAQTLDPLALPALLSETRGQNSWVNYSPANADVIDQMNRLKMQARERKVAEEWLAKYPSDTDPRYGGDARRALGELPSAEEIRGQLHALGQQFQYAPQRAVTLPPEFLPALTPGGQPDWMRAIMQPRAATDDVRGVHFSREGDLLATDPSFYGTGAFSGERQMVKQAGLPDRTYFYTGPEGTVMPEESVGKVGQNVYEGRLSGLYDIEADPEGLRRLARAYNLPDYAPTLGEPLAYRGGVEGKGAVTDMERLIRDYGYEGFLTPNAAAVYSPVTGLRKIQRKAGGYSEGGSVG